MPTTVKLDMPAAQEFVRRRGIGPGGKVQKLLTNSIHKDSAPYTPMKTGSLQRIVEIPPSGTYLQYNSPYARYLYFGEVMVGIKSRKAWANKGEQKELLLPKKKLKFSGAPKRGAYWVQRMWSEKGKQIIRSVAKMAGGKPG